MRQFLTIALLFLITVFSFGQNENQNSESLKMTETDSLYLIALQKYTVEIDSFYNKYSQNKLTKTIFIEYQDYLSNIPDSVKGYRVQAIGLENRKKIFAENKNKLLLVKIFPLTLEKGRFRITLIPYFAELKKEDLFLELSDWTRVFFEFKNGRLEYVKTENGGI